LAGRVHEFRRTLPSSYTWRLIGRRRLTKDMKGAEKVSVHGSRGEAVKKELIYLRKGCVHSDFPPALPFHAE
jgi:hypothetical protein